MKRREAIKIVSKAVAELMADINGMNPWDENYTAAIKNLKEEVEVLEKLEGRRIDPNVLMQGAISIGGILITVLYEHAHVLTSKALSMWVKPKF